MKPAMLFAAVLVALVAGGCAATGDATGDGESAPTMQAPVKPVPEPNHDLREDLLQRNARIAALEAENLAHRKRIDTLTARIASLETPVLPPEDMEGFDDAVSKILKEKEKEMRAEREIRRSEIMSRMSRSNDRILTTLSDKLSLTEPQKKKIKAHIDEFGKKRAEVFVTAMEARRNGEEFDVSAEFARVNKEAKDAVRAELSAAQSATFDKLVGDKGITSLDRDRWMRAR